METVKCYCIFYIFLLTMTGPALCLKLETEENSYGGQKRQLAVAPIAVYAGAAVSPWLWVALIAAYGAAALTQYHVTKTSSDSHSCANNRGWCRSTCFSHEYIDWAHTAVCGNYHCCRPGN
nr:big defensin [Meretrix meretrix]